MVNFDRECVVTVTERNQNSMSRLQLLRAGFRYVASTLLATVLVLLLLNAACSLAFVLRDGFSPQGTSPVQQKYDSVEWAAVYPDLEVEQIEQLLRETWSRTQAYEPLTQFTERPYKGEYVNVSEMGFRIGRNQGPWPPDDHDYNMFVFGGSTTFGYGVPDEQTIASHLQEVLSHQTAREVRVYNFGRGMYRSSQERVLFEELLVSEFVPDMAVFIDGLNDFAFPEPGHTTPLRTFFDQGRTVSKLQDDGLGRRLRAVSLLRAVRAVRRRLVGPYDVEAIPDPEPAAGRWTSEDEQSIRDVAHRYLKNLQVVRAVADAHGVASAFVWQPVPNYKYDLQYHPFVDGGFGINRRAPRGYALMEELVEQEPPGREFIWCADFQEGLSEPLYVDQIHYSGMMSQLIARAIAAALEERSLFVSATAAPSGAGPIFRTLPSESWAVRC